MYTQLIKCAIHTVRICKGLRRADCCTNKQALAQPSLQTCENMTNYPLCRSQWCSINTESRREQPVLCLRGHEHCILLKATLIGVIKQHLFVALADKAGCEVNVLGIGLS